MLKDVCCCCCCLSFLFSSSLLSLAVVLYARDCSFWSAGICTTVKWLNIHYFLTGTGYHLESTQTWDTCTGISSNTDWWVSKGCLFRHTPFHWPLPSQERSYTCVYDMYMYVSHDHMLPSHTHCTGYPHCLGYSTVCSSGGMYTYM